MAGVPMDQREGWIWFDGELKPWKDAKIHVLTHGLHYASSVFEGERAYGGEIFKSREHTERLIRSAATLDMPFPYSVDEIEAAKRLVLDKNGLVDAYVRPVAWRGSEELSVPARNNKVHVAIAAWVWPSYFSVEEKLKGIRLEWSKWKRPSPETIPSSAKAAGLYMICTLSKDHAMANGFADALMLDYRGYVAEATGANVPDTENLINLPLQIATVEVSIIMTEPKDFGPVRMSLRSKGQIDVAKFAEQFGGGGHARAAGLKLEGSFQDAHDRVIEAMIAAMK